jgi:hypothetical protein
MSLPIEGLIRTRVARLGDRWIAQRAGNRTQRDEFENGGGSVRGPRRACNSLSADLDALDKDFGYRDEIGERCASALRRRCGAANSACVCGAGGRLARTHTGRQASNGTGVGNRRCSRICHGTPLVIIFRALTRRSILCPTCGGPAASSVLSGLVHAIPRMNVRRCRRCPALSFLFSVLFC